MKIKEKFLSTESNGRILFTSDIHYNHSNIIQHSGRPFKDVTEMNNFILGELKSKIKPEDILFDLGDMFWKMSPQEICNVLDQIPTKNIYKIVGNHDKYGIYYGSGGIEIRERLKMVCDILDIQVESWKTRKTYMVTMSHYPMVSWNHKPHGSIHLHGHCHGNIDDYNKSVYDLRVDLSYDAELSRNLGSFIIDFEDIVKFFDEKTDGEDYKKWTLSRCKEL